MDPSFSSNSKCPRCGESLPADAVVGLCPRCLMVGAMEPTQAGEPAPSLPSLTPEELAPHFPQLEILECLGRGGMGVVYKARQKSLSRFVALKLLAPERAGDPLFAARFEKEAHALAALNHPNIVGVYDFGVTQTLLSENPTYFLLMEFVDGVNLRQLLQTKRLTPKEALSIVPPVCQALQCAHDRGIVHRDIKPENLLIDKAGTVKIADFGIAKIVCSDTDPTVGASSEQTGVSASLPLGTPDYAAPEQNDGATTDHRADIYSLGVVLYEMLTGERPKDDIVPPSKRVQVDIRIDEIVLRALEKTPELRFDTAAEFGSQVEAAEDGGTPAKKPMLIEPLTMGLIGLVGVSVLWRFLVLWIAGGEASGLKEFAVLAAIPLILGGLLWVGFAGVRRVQCRFSSTARIASSARRKTEIGFAMLAVVLFVLINRVHISEPTGLWTADRVSDSAPATGTVVVHIEKAERRGQTVWVLMHTDSHGQPVRIRPQFFAWLSKLPPKVPVEPHSGGSTGEEVVLTLQPGPSPYEARMVSRDVPDISGPGPNWIGFALPSVDAATVALDQITRLHLNRPKGITPDRSTLLLFHLTARGDKPDADQHLNADLSFELGPQTSATAMHWPKVASGRVVGLVIPDAAVDTGCLLDFETGRFLVPPRELAEKLTKGGAEIGEEHSRWLRESGADAAVRMPDGGTLRLFEGFALTRSRNLDLPLRWEQFTDNEVMDTLNTATFEQQQRFVNSGRGYYATPATAPTALAFMTREGSMGLLEILGRDANPSGVKIRYRLIKVAGL